MMLIAWATGDAVAKPGSIDGSCAGFDIPVNKDGSVDWIGTIKVLREGAPVYATPRSRNKMADLAFGRTLEIVSMKGRRLEVQTFSDEEPLGWVESSDLLCNERPLRGSKGLEQKLYIRTETTVRGDKPATVKAFPNPSGDACDGKCRELSRFNGYFIFAVDRKSGRLLLADNYLLDETTMLVGWVDRKDGFIWETAYGLRPKEVLVYAKGHENAGQERAICIFPTLEDAELGRKCHPVLGGDRWYLYPDRIPVLGRKGRYFRVIVPLAGTGIQRQGDAKFTISPEVLGRKTDALESLEKLKRVDIFFLVDGTQSMDPFIAAIRGTGDRPGIVQRIIKAFGEDDAFRQTQLRFGFRVYRDGFAGNGGIGEGLPLDTDCEVTAGSLGANLKKFETAIAKVRATTTDFAQGDTDYEENLLGGIHQALDDVLTCPDNTKVLFVIGDHGYNADAQRARGNRAIGIGELTANMAGSRERGEKSVVTFFIQTPNGVATARSPAAYRRAYDLFKQQGRSMVRTILGSKHAGETDRFLLVSNDGQLPEKITGAVKLFGDSRVVNEIIADLRGGTPLVEVITRLQGAREFKNLPGLFWDIIEQGSCRALGKQCNERIYETVLEGFVRDNSDVVIDVWLKSDDLTRWVSLLNLMRDVRQYSGKEQRIAFVQALVDTLQSVIAKPLYEDTDETLGDYLERKGGLPVRDTSPLMKYSLKTLMNPRKVPNCEILRLATWVQNAKQMLAVVSKGDRRPVFKTEEYPGECPGGKDIPFIDGDIDQRPLGEEGMNYGHPFQKAKIFWVQKGFLP